jgi:hypothetical protein
MSFIKSFKQTGASMPNLLSNYFFIEDCKDPIQKIVSNDERNMRSEMNFIGRGEVVDDRRADRLLELNRIIDKVVNSTRVNELETRSVVKETIDDSECEASLDTIIMDEEDLILFDILGEYRRLINITNPSLEDLQKMATIIELSSFERTLAALIDKTDTEYINDHYR